METPESTVDTTEVSTPAVSNKYSSEINKINSYVKPNGNTAVVINDKIFVSAAQVEQACGVKRNYNVLVGSTINAEFFANGEVLGNGVACNVDAKITKSIAIKLSPRLQAIADAAAF